ncbi:MAG: hypothetical protein WCY76_04540 [Leucobacter sp.]
MNTEPVRHERGRGRRVLLIALLVIALLVLGVVVAVVTPMLLHRSAGDSGQVIPEGFVAETTAVGMDGRERVLAVERSTGGAQDLAELQPGEQLVVTGSGFDAGIGIYVGICAIPDAPATRPGPCLGGIPEGAETGDAESGAASAWVTDDWAWRAFATHRYENAEEGSFRVTLTVPDPVSDNLDCRVTSCAVATRADHTAGADRVQDMLLPVSFAE